MKRQDAQEETEEIDRPTFPSRLPHAGRRTNIADLHDRRLASIIDRVDERFVRPLMIDRVKALVEPTLAAAGAAGKEVKSNSPGKSCSIS